MQAGCACEWVGTVTGYGEVLIADSSPSGVGRGDTSPAHV